MPSILITGASGYLGQRVARRAVSAGWKVTGTYHSRQSTVDGVTWRRLDVRDRAATTDLMHQVRPGVVLNAATGRDQNDWAVIADGAAAVTVAAVAVGARLVHVSSDAVLGGTAAPYEESALPDPVNRYGAAKAAAETVVKAVAPAAVIARVPLIVGDGQSKHECLVYNLANGAPGALFTDVYRTPVHVDDLSDALLEVAAGDCRGVLNIAGPDAISWYEFGRLVAVRDGLDPDRLPAGRAEGSGIVMPADTRLCTERAGRLLRTRLRGVHEFLAPAAS